MNSKKEWNECHKKGTVWWIENPGEEPKKVYEMYIGPLSYKKLIESLWYKSHEDKTFWITCKNGDKLFFVNGKTPYFRHYAKSYDDIWNKEWRTRFINIGVDTEKYFHKIDGCYTGRRADIFINNTVVEFQNTPIDYKEVKERKHDYNIFGYDIVWVINSLNSAITTHNNIYFIDLSHGWMQYSFTDYDYIFLDDGTYIYRIFQNNIMGCFAETYDRILHDEFIEYLKGTYIWDTIKSPLRNLYFNQRGAGCGKTYESVQLPRNNNFLHKNLFIYLTKMNSAKSVINKEFEEQYEGGKLIGINLTDSDYNGKQYIKKITYQNMEKTIIIATMDSFSYHFGDDKNKEWDMFYGYVKSIIAGYFTNVLTDTNTSKKTYAGETIRLNQKCLIVIDETQDLPEYYIEAIIRIMKETNIDVYLIGDKLQSIWGAKNVYTYFDSIPEGEYKGITIHKTEGINLVRRFHNNELMYYVNKTIDFKRWELPEISGICDGNCDYDHMPDNVESIKLKRIYHDDKDMEKMKIASNDIIDKIQSEVDKYNYSPENFMIIFPFISKNIFAERLCTYISEFWANYYGDLNKKYVFLHKSDDNKPINLTESENMTRIMSIHASKGTGREVVFLLGLSDFSIERFSIKPNNLIYESLIHVAITRQKRKLYIGIEEEYNHQIYEKLGFYNSEGKITIPANIKLTDILSFIENINSKLKEELNFQYIESGFKYDDENKEIFDMIKYLLEVNIDLENYKDLIPEPEYNDSGNREPIDWGHHIIRNAIFHTQIEMRLLESHFNKDFKCSDFNHIIKVLENLSKLDIMDCPKDDYYEFLYGKKQYKKGKIGYSERKQYRSERINKSGNFPLLIYRKKEIMEHKAYMNTKIIMKYIIAKLKDIIKNKKILPFCDIECIVFQHMMETYNSDIINISIDDVYDIVHYYGKVFSMSELNHDNYKCKCNKIFNEPGGIIGNDEIKTSLNVHYKLVEKIKLIYQDFIECCKEKNIKKFNLSKRIRYNINTDEYLSIKDSIYITGRNDTEIILIVIKPTFNKVNFNNVMFEMVFKNYLMLKCGNNKVNNRIITTYLFTLDSDKVIQFEFNLQDKIECIDTFIKEYSYRTYSSINEKIHNHIVAKKLKHINFNEFINVKRNTDDKKINYPKYIESLEDGFNESIEDGDDINYFQKLNRRLKSHIDKL